MAEHRREETEPIEDLVAFQYDLAELLPHILPAVLAPHIAWLEAWAMADSEDIERVKGGPRMATLTLETELATIATILEHLRGEVDDDTRGSTARGDVSAHSGDQEDTSR